MNNNDQLNNNEQINNNDQMNDNEILESCNCFTLQDRLDLALLQLKDIESNQTEIINNIDNITIQTESHPIFIFLLFFIAFITFDFWSQTLNIFIKEQFHDGEQPSWKAMAIYSLIISIIFIIIIIFAGIPLTTFETV